jgi:hypothetical protein
VAAKASPELQQAALLRIDLNSVVQLPKESVAACWSISSGKALGR